jgi:Zn-dependent protease with chaperone function
VGILYLTAPFCSALVIEFLIERGPSLAWIIPTNTLDRLAVWWSNLIGSVAVLWLLGLTALYLVGVFMSRRTIAAIKRGGLEIGKKERAMRTAYRVTIAITSLYVYLSMAVMVLLVLSLPVISLLLSHYIIFFLVLLAPGIYTLFSIARSVRAVAGQESFGRPLPRDEAPGLWALATEVAEGLDTRPVDAIFVAPTPGVSVIECGSLATKLRGLGQRGLILGLGALPGLTQVQLAAILAHEYGHFVGRDTAWDVLERHAGVSLSRLTYALASRERMWWGPSRLFVRALRRMFLRITMGASRMREILADQRAASVYGKQNLIDALKHLVHADITFGARVTKETDLAMRIRTNLKNLYAGPPLSGALLEEVRSKTDEEMSRPTSPYDTHPGMADRIRLLEQLDVPEPAYHAALGQSPAWDLFVNAEELQEEMTYLIEIDFKRRISHNW